MTYSRKSLKSLFKDSWNTPEYQNITGLLLTKMFAGEYLTLAEEEYACITAKSLRSDDPSFKEISPKDYIGCANYWFRYRFLLYFNNLDCYGRVIDSDGKPVSQEQMYNDRVYFEAEYKNWTTIIETKTSDKLIEHIALETKHQIKNILTYCKRMFIWRFRREYLIKSIVLQGRFIYYQVREFYEELGKSEEVVELFGNKILINSYCYVHILFRHYSAIVKEHQIDKTYHYDENIDYKEIPSFLKGIIEVFKDNCSLLDFDGRSINFMQNKRIYTIWFRSFQISKPGNIVETYMRLQSFYPAELPSELLRISKLKKIDVNSNISFFVNP